MKNTFCYVLLFLLGLTIMASCGEKPEHKATETVDQKQTIETVEEKSEDVLSFALSYIPVKALCEEQADNVSNDSYSSEYDCTSRLVSSKGSHSAQQG